MLKSAMRTVGLAAVMVAAAVSTARADSYLSPFAGVTFGGSALSPSLADAARNDHVFIWGANLGVMAGGIAGPELDFAYCSNFFGSTTAVRKDRLYTIVPNVIFGIPIGSETGPGIRPYGTAGFGVVIRSLSAEGIDAVVGADPVYSYGGGVMGFFANHAGFRADYRRMRTVSNRVSNNNIDFRPGHFEFSRVTGAIVIRW